MEEKLLVHLGEIDTRKLYLDLGFPSMFAFCVGELGFSEDVGYNRIMVARAARRMPAILDAVRTGQVHLAGLRVLAPHLTIENHGKVLAEAAGKSKREIEELVARLSPQPPVATVVRKIPSRPEAPAEALPLPSALPRRCHPRSRPRPLPCRHPRALSGVTRLPRSPRTPTSSSSPGPARAASSSARCRTCSATGFPTEMWGPSSRSRST